jgi:uncharacterized membrane protein YebE (DUF533 family)
MIDMAIDVQEMEKIREAANVFGRDCERLRFMQDEEAQLLEIDRLEAEAVSIKNRLELFVKNHSN